VPLPLRRGFEPWLSKQQLADYLGFSKRWVELKVREGMPCHRWGKRLRCRASEVEAWLEEREG
jgi:excisionase family DNA binding protein